MLCDKLRNLDMDNTCFKVIYLQWLGKKRQTNKLINIDVLNGYSKHLRFYVFQTQKAVDKAIIESL